MADNKKGSVVLTGAGGGMGQATAKKLIAEGYEVFGLDLREPDDIRELRFIKTDLSDPGSVENAFTQISAETDEICGIIHMAGLYDLDSLVEIKEEDLMKIFNVNLFAIMRVNRIFLPLLSKGGRIVITSSELAPLDPLPFTGLYAVTKAAVEKYAYSLRMELQLLGYQVIVIRPGAVDTHFLKISTDRLKAFCDGTELYSVNASKFRKIVDRAESVRAKPEKIADKIYTALNSKRPKFVYKINRNIWLLMLNAVPDRMQTKLIGRIIK